MLLTEKDQKVLNSYEMLLLSEKLFQKYRPAALMIQIVNIDKSEDASVFILVGKNQQTSSSKLILHSCRVHISQSDKVARYRQQRLPSYCVLKTHHTIRL